MKQQFIQFLHGCVQVCVRGGNIQRFINLCRMQGIYVWDVHPGTEYTLWMEVESFFLLQGIIRKTGVRVHVMAKKGVPFLVYRNRKRKGFFLGMFTAFCLIYVLSQYIWDVQVSGNYSHSAEELLKFLKTQNVYSGIKKDNLDCDELEKEIRNQFFDVTWVSAEITGTRLIVHLKENEQRLTEESVEESVNTAPMDIVASKDARIVSVVTRSGTAQVKAEMEVKQGDLLVHGYYQVINDSQEVVRTQYLTADAEILGQVVYEYEYTLPMTYQKKEYAEEKKEYSFRIGNQRFDLYGKNEAAKQDCITEERQLTLHDNFCLPVYIIENTKKNYEIKEYTYTKEEAEAICREKLTYFLQNLEKNTIQIIENNVTIEVTDTVCVSRGTVTAVEDIGEAVPATILEEQTEEMSIGE